MKSCFVIRADEPLIGTKPKGVTGEDPVIAIAGIIQNQAYSRSKTKNEYVHTNRVGGPNCGAPAAICSSRYLMEGIDSA